MNNQGCKRMASEDKITTFPDDILLSILSLLTFKEAVATSILSRRWRYLWTSLPSLHFRYEDVVQRRYLWTSLPSLHFRYKYDVQKDDKDNMLQHYCKVYGVYKDRCIQMVNQLLRARKVRELQEFGIHYPLLESSACHIDLWVAFAIAIGVSKLELNFSPYPYLIPLSFDKNYSIPLDLFDKTKGMEPFLVQLEHVFSISTSSLNIQNRFKSLRELVLKFVDLTDEHFETILSNCTSLECLHLNHSSRLVNVKHTVPHMKLSCLEIYHCSKLENVEIFAPNLVSFKYRGPRIYIFVKDAKQLVDLCMCSYWQCELEYPLENSLGLPYMQRKDFVFGQFADYLSRLEYLVMDVGSFEGKQGFNKWDATLLSYGCRLCQGLTILASTRVTFSFGSYQKSRIEKNCYISAQISEGVVRRCIGQLHQRLPANAQLHFLDDHF
ncbi:hypothetical protein HRI_000222100 [Hibiscus trionum]|uniref:F-box domain-containing protein n=1 Tax=Hibiscus trionum TaxID=183268 RepID=A0A9W7GW07_HIBTR|nr:hypothetical protein HRI_000222100 [Hibiscus trionum]